MVTTQYSIHNIHLLLQTGFYKVVLHCTLKTGFIQGYKDTRINPVKFQQKIMQAFSALKTPCFYSGIGNLGGFQGCVMVFTWISFLCGKNLEN